MTLLTSLIGMFGVLLGVGLTSFVNWKLKTKEAQLRILEKVYDKRLLAHEEVLEISRHLRTTISTKTADEAGNIISYPAIIANKITFGQFQQHFYELINFNSHWLDIDLFRELNFVQDYIVNVDMILKNASDERFPDIAIIIKQDFIDLAASLETETIKFFEKDLNKIKIKTDKQHHKYKRLETNKRLQNTELFKNWKEIEKITDHNNKAF